MITILIVDDNNVRLDEIKQVCNAIFGITPFSFDSARTVIEAQEKLVHGYYDLLIIDINLPHRDGEMPKRDAGLKLLRRLVNSRKYIVPNHIVAITAYPDIKEEFISDFDEHTVTVVQYTVTSEKWKVQIQSKLNQILYSKIRKPTDGDKAVVLITVHGIRTFGEWQKRLKDLVFTYNPNIDVYSYKYGYFSIISYALPLLRKMVSNNFLRELKRYIQLRNGRRIDIVAHSFGTFIVANAIKQLSADEVGVIRNVIFAGSVLPSNFDCQSLVQNGLISRVINECGIHDTVLVFNGLLVPFVGVAGLTGFTGMTNDTFMNRYFNGHHSHYFLNNGKPYDDFMEQYWLPIIVSDELPKEVDERKSPNLLRGIWEALVFNISYLKFIIYVLIILILYSVATAAINH